MNDKERRKKKLLSLPSVENFTRNNAPRVDDTAVALSNFDKNPPRFSLAPVKKLCADIVLDALSGEEIEARIGRIRHPAAHQAAREIIPAFQRYALENDFEGVGDFRGFRITYPIGPSPSGGTLNIPIIPTFVAFVRGQLTPIFLIPWTKMALKDFQKFLMSSIINDALLTHQDFLDCDAAVVAFPRIEETLERYPTAWGVKSYAQMDRERLNHQFMTYGKALKEVIDELDAEAE